MNEFIKAGIQKKKKSTTTVSLIRRLKQWNTQVLHTHTHTHTHTHARARIPDVVSIVVHFPDPLDAKI